MSKGIERKKETKKKPAKSLMEKRAAKAEKRSQKRQWRTSRALVRPPERPLTGVSRGSFLGRFG